MNGYKHINYDPVVDVSHWEKWGSWNTGVRAKHVLISPETGLFHLFKCPKEHREHQVWSELIASFVAGDLLGWDVQTVRIAKYNDRHGSARYGNLIDYFYEVNPIHQSSDDSTAVDNERKSESFLEGLSLCQSVDLEYDQKKGYRHTLKLLQLVAAILNQSESGITRNDFMEFWAQAIAFDSLISNTDRHAENWGIIVSNGRARMAPLYDNGSSLGCGIDNVGLTKAFDDHGKVKQSHIGRQLVNGRHHVRLGAPGKQGAKFQDLGKKILKIFPSGEKWFRQAAEVDVAQVRELLDDIRQVSNTPEPFALSERRCEQICAMLEMGKERLRRIIDE